MVFFHQGLGAINDAEARMFFNMNSDVFVIILSQVKLPHSIIKVQYDIKQKKQYKNNIS